MGDKITVNPDEMQGIVSKIEAIVTDLNSSYESLDNIINSEYYLEGMAKGQIGIFNIVTVRMDELISHYTRLQEYVSYSGETFVEMDQAISNSVQK